MPYILKAERPKFAEAINELSQRIETEGDLNYIITRLLHNEVTKRGKRYAVLNMLLGVLDAASKEFYRRVVGPYEDVKAKENGDVI